MRMRHVVLGLVVLLFAADASATVINAAELKPVTLNGAFGVMVGDWTPGPLASGDSLVDGAFLLTGSIWQTDTVWWDTRNSASVGNSIEIDLQGDYVLDSFTVQADNNDFYRIEYWSGGGWVTAWDVPAVAGWGMYDRSYTLLSSIVTDQLRFTAIGGDGYYSVSEIQAFGTPVPEPGTASLLVLGCAALGARMRRRRRS